MPIKAYRSRSAHDREDGVSVSPHSSRFGRRLSLHSSSGSDSSSGDEIEPFSDDSGRAWSQRAHSRAYGGTLQPLQLMTPKQRDQRRAERERVERPITEAQKRRAELNRKRAMLLKRKKETRDRHVNAEHNVQRHKEMMRERELEYDRGIGKPKEYDEILLDQLEQRSREAHRLARNAHEAAKEFDVWLRKYREGLLRY